MPRLFQLYLMVASIVVIFVLGMVSLTGGSFPFSSSPIRDRQHEKLHQLNDGHDAHESLPSPDQVIQQHQPPAQHEQIPKPNHNQNVDHDHHQSLHTEVPSDEVLFTFDEGNRDREISYERDLMHQSINDDQKEVISAMKHSWDAYRTYAWGADHLKPISKTSQNWFHTGLTIIDSMDTLLLMGPDMRYAYDQALEWLQHDLTFDIHRDVNCFETTIRVLGGLLSSFHLTKSPDILHKAVDLADRLIHCFDSGSSVPFSDVNLRTKTPASPAWSPESSLSEVSSMQLEFRDVSRLTGDARYEKKSFATSQHLHDLVRKRSDPLLPMYINPNTGDLSSSATVTLGARGDSYYEYLLKQFLQTDIQWLRDDYVDAMNAVSERLMKRTTGPQKLIFVSELMRGQQVNPKMDHLTCFLPGTLILGYYDQLKVHEKDGDKRFASHLSLAEDLARTCYTTYNMTETGLAPEITYFSTSDESKEQEAYIKSADRHNLLRPEYVESLFYLYHITGKEVYREQGRRILNSFNKYCKVQEGGFTSIDDVTHADHVKPRDMMESFWTAETLKYLFLLFSDDKQLLNKILHHYVLNTEAHLIPRTLV